MALAAGINQAWQRNVNHYSTRPLFNMLLRACGDMKAYGGMQRRRS